MASLEIDENLLREASLTVEDFRKEIAITFFEKKIFNFTQARKFSGMSRVDFERLLASNKIGIYTMEDYRHDAGEVNKFL